MLIFINDALFFFCNYALNLICILYEIFYLLNLVFDEYELTKHLRMFSDQLFPSTQC